MENDKSYKKETKGMAVMVFVIIGIIVCVVIYCVLWQNCIIVSAHEWKEATCINPEKCSRCGKIRNEAFGHTFSAATCTEAKKCSRCGSTEGEPLGHTIPQWTTNAEPTCTEAGSKSGVCTVCGSTETEILPRLNHVLGEWEIGREATISLSGLKIQKCTVCGEIIKKESFSLSDDEIIRLSLPITVLSAKKSGSYIITHYKVQNNLYQDIRRVDLKLTLLDVNGNPITSKSISMYNLPKREFKEAQELMLYSGEFSSYKLEVVDVTF